MLVRGRVSLFFVFDSNACKSQSLVFKTGNAGKVTHTTVGFRGLLQTAFSCIPISKIATVLGHGETKLIHPKIVNYGVRKYKRKAKRA